MLRGLATGMFSALALSFSFCPAVSAQVNVLTYHNDNMRTGANLEETSLTPANVNSSSFGKLFSYGLDGDVYAQPLFLSGLNIAGRGVHNVIFVATQHNSVYALDADSSSGPTGGVLWQVNLGPSAATPNSDFGTRYGSFAITPEIGITGTPVIDPGSGTLFVDVFTHEGGTYYHKLHALDVSSGAERSYSPVIVDAAIPGTGAGSSTNGTLRFEARQHLQRAALTLANGVVYVAYAGNGETDPFHGWLIGYNAGNLQPLANFVFNSTPNSMARDFGPNAGEGGIWMGGCGPAVDAAGNLFLATGNGSFNAATTNGTEYGSSFLKLSTAGGLSVADYFTPFNQKYLSDNDLDVGAGGIVLLPDQPGPYPHLLVGAGKPGTAYLLNRDQFTAGNNHYSATGAVDVVAQKLSLGGGVMTTPAYFDGTIYYAASKDVLSALTLSNGLLPSRATASGSRVFNYPGVTPSVSANGNRDGIVWAIQRASPAVLVAYDAANIAEEIYDSSQAGTRDRLGDAIKFSVPTIANGKVFVGGQSSLSVFGLLPQTPAPPINNSGPGGNYNGLFFEAGGVQLSTSGSFALTITRRGTYTGKLQIGSTRYPFRGQLDSGGSAANTIPRRGASALTLTFQIDPDTSSRISGTLSAGVWTADLIADQSTFNTRTNPAPFAGRYTAIFPGSTNLDSGTPSGSGFATILVNRSGTVACTAALADGTKLTQSAYLASAGHWPFYATLYRGRGQLLGWLTLANFGPPILAGQTSWLKVAASGGTYSGDGFDLLVSPTGSTYQAPTRGLPILDLSEGSLSFRGGNLSENFTNGVTLAGNNKVVNLSANKLTLTMTPASGLFRGSVVSPDGGKPISFSGVILQNQNSGSGYFLLSNESGRVDLRAK